MGFKGTATWGSELGPSRDLGVAAPLEPQSQGTIREEGQSDTARIYAALTVPGPVL